MRSQLRITGFGGQGIILAGYIIGKAASIYDAKHATMVQAYGPEARGSACSAQVTVNAEPILYPYMKDVDVLLALSQEGYDKFAPELRPAGVLLYDEDLVELKTAPVARVAESVPATRIAEDLGRAMVANIVMLGFFTAKTEIISAEAMKDAIADSVPRGTEELNTMAFERGFQFQPTASTVGAGV